MKDRDVEHTVHSSTTPEGLRLVGDAWTPSGERRGNVLLLHGGGQTRHSWRRTGGRLARDGWGAFAFDARGHGDSSWAVDGDYSLDGFIRDAASVLDEVGAPAVAVGASLGGMTALVGLGERSLSLRGLVLVDVVARMNPSGVARIDAFMTSAPDGYASLEDAASAIASYNPHRPRPASPRGLQKNLRLRDDNRWHWHWDPAFLRAGSEPERDAGVERMLAAARSVTAQTLVVRGSNSDIVSEAGLDEMIGLMAHARGITVNGTGHMLAGDDNDVFASSLVDFLESIESA